jgi:hypothetical protein
MIDHKAAIAKAIHRYSEVHSPFAVRWQPPYSNAPKAQPCATYKEAELLRDWFRSINIIAEIIRYEVIEREVDYG